MERSNIEKIAQSAEDRLLLAKLWDKINAGMRKNIPAATCFLSPRELEMAKYLFGEQEGLYAFGGYEDAERKMLIFLPDYLDEASLCGEDSPCVCLRAAFFQGDSPSHRDFLGALMGAGVGRETVGDICVDKGSCDFFVTAEIAPYLLQTFTSAGRTKLHLSQIPLSGVHIPEPEIKEIRDTLASLRLDSVVSSGFRIGRSLAAQYVSAGKAAIDGLPCEKPDKPVPGRRKNLRPGTGKNQACGHQRPDEKRQNFGGHPPVCVRFYKKHENGRSDRQNQCSGKESKSRGPDPRGAGRAGQAAANLHRFR